MADSPNLDPVFAKLSEGDADGALVEWDKAMIEHLGLDVSVEEWRQMREGHDDEARERFVGALQALAVYQQH